MIVNLNIETIINGQYLHHISREEWLIMKDLTFETGLSKLIFIMGVIVTALVVFIITLCLITKETNYIPYVSSSVACAILWLSYYLLKRAINIKSKTDANKGHLD